MFAVGPGGHRDGAPVRAGGADRVGGVDDEVQHHLVDVADVAPYRRQFGEVGVYVGHVLQLAVGDHEGVADRLVEVDRCLLLVAGVSEGLHRPDDRRHPVHAVQRLADRLRYLLDDELDVDVVLHPAYRGDRVGPGRLLLRAHDVVARGTQLEQVVERALQEPHVVSDELDRGVDFVGDPGRELPDRLQLLRVPQADLGLPFAFPALLQLAGLGCVLVGLAAQDPLVLGEDAPAQDQQEQADREDDRGDHHERALELVQRGRAAPGVLAFVRGRPVDQVGDRAERGPGELVVDVQRALRVPGLGEGEGRVDHLPVPVVVGHHLLLELSQGGGVAGVGGRQPVDTPQGLVELLRGRVELGAQRGVRPLRMFVVRALQLLLVHQRDADLLVHVVALDGVEDDGTGVVGHRGRPDREGRERDEHQGQATGGEPDHPRSPAGIEQHATRGHRYLLPAPGYLPPQALGNPSIRWQPHSA